MSERFASFREFYPFYLGEHQNTVCRRLHFVGPSCAILFIARVGGEVGAVAEVLAAPEEKYHSRHFEAVE